MVNTPLEKNYSPDSSEPPSGHVSENSLLLKPAGVRKVEASLAVWGPKNKWLLFFGLALSSYIYSLDGTTTWTYLVYALSSIEKHSSVGTVQTANAIIIAIGKPFMAKLSDVIGRGETLLLIAILYGVGYAIIASMTSLGQLSAGQVIYSFGYTGLQLVLQIIIADVTTLRWRGLVSALLSFPFIINSFAGSEVSAAVIKNSTWQWGYGMFAIMTPACLLIIIVCMLWSQWKGAKVLREQGDRLDDEIPFGKRTMMALRDMDFFGLILCGTSLALILLPLTLARTAKGQWNNPSMIAMEVVGAILFPVFLVYEAYVPARPVFPMRWLRRLPILGACLIGFCDFVSFYLQFTYLYSYIFVTQSFNVREQNYFASTQTLCLTAFAIIGGVIMYATRRFKWMLVVGLFIRLLGVGIMFHARGPSGNVASLVMCQVLQGIGGGFAATTTQVAAQAAVSHVDVATVTAMVLLLTEVGNAVGSAAAAGVWTQYMPGELAKHLPMANQTLINELFGSITMIATYPKDDAIRMGAIAAYQDLMHRLLIGSIVVAIFPPLFAIFLIKDIKLTDTQNAHDGKNNAGEQVEAPEESYVQETKEATQRARTHII